ncbi:hypothetical protein CDO52_14580 [Nocardiopsis gilva YIM 90087]|uniref:Uncharacterized protein n=1 Tax=Nocardiopsis gilva YIM 90087 TaxID=1235441 RepID=A0A223S6U9_9ACTN|nr:hypothetical protein [Nocardiopsis gilva]ASU83847.1 hypothetical protein CDO52_14580 [Nocardiopsis gilva YIM 90087]
MGARRPILVFEGMQGIGKSALLDHIAGLLHQQVPYAYIDFQHTPQADVAKVLSALAFELSRHTPNYGRLNFPRMIIGQLVLRLDLSHTDRNGAREQVIAEIKKHRKLDRIEELLRETADDIVSLPVEPLTGNVATRAFGRPVATAVGALTSWTLSSRPFLGRHQDWYGHRDQGYTDDPIDALVQLNQQWNAPHHDGGRDQAADVLCAAFLADLRDAFAHGGRSASWLLTPVVLLDNVDEEPGRGFLDHLARVRRTTEIDDRYGALTIVATSRGPLLWALPDDVTVTISTNIPVEAARPRPGPGDRPPDWARYVLSDLTEEETDTLITRAGLSARTDRHSAKIIHGFTSGHPGSTRLLLDTIARMSPRQSLARVLAGASDDAPAFPTVQQENRLFRELLGVPGNTTVPKGLVHAMTTCAAARTGDDALRLAQTSQLVQPAYRDRAELRRPTPRFAHGTGGEALLRRLLLRRLARRGPNTKTNWSQVFGWLHAEARRRDDLVGLLYYALAVGDLGFVAGELTERFDKGHGATGAVAPPPDGTAFGAAEGAEARTWNGLLTAVTLAPRSEVGLDRPAPIEHVHALLAQAAEDGESASADGLPFALQIRRLVAALWLAADPFTGPERRHLHEQIAADYRALALGSPHSPAELFTAAETHDRLAHLWS